MTVLVVLVAWFAAGTLATLLLGPRLRRAAEAAGVALEPEPVVLGGRSPLRWRLGTLGVVGLLAGSTGMAAAGALPGSAQTIAHHVLGSVGVHVPEDAPAAETASGPVDTPGADVGSDAAPPGTSTAPDWAPDPSSPAGGGPGAEASDVTVAADDEVAATTPSTAASEGVSTDSPSAPEVRSEPSDVPGDEGGVPVPEPSDVPADPVAEEPPPTTTTTTPPGEEPPAGEPPGDEPPTASGEPTTTTTLPPPPPAEEPAG